MLYNICPTKQITRPPQQTTIYNFLNERHVDCPSVNCANEAKCSGVGSPCFACPGPRILMCMCRLLVMLAMVLCGTMYGTVHGLSVKHNVLNYAIINLLHTVITKYVRLIITQIK